MKCQARIHCFSFSSIRPSCYRIKIYENERLVVESKTDFLGNFVFCPEYGKIYQIEVFEAHSKVYDTIYFCHKKEEDLCFGIRKIFSIPFHVTERYYPGLKIEKGVIRLWPNLTQ